ncbi:F-box/kelch-repeat protein [Cardamine amara subsp. amara]|uniref:F-box/kelch-repeat protein n=1 Tax=Cardamine amara subsp. amara TaxID=228776 RepID=A0ABD1AKM4_CARAN
MSEPETKNKNTSSLIMPDWSRLPEELLHLISKNLEDEDYCFDVVHARSVCSSWRSAFPFPSSIIRTSYSLPKFDKFPLESEGLCAVEKVPFFLFRLRAPSTDAAAELLIGGISGDDHMQLPSPIQCSVKIKIPGSAPSLMNTLDCQILPLGISTELLVAILEITEA